MPEAFHHKRERPIEGEFYTDCLARESAGCEWDYFAPDQKTADMATMLHLLVKHPEAYRASSGGIDPDERQRQWAGQIRVFRTVI